MGLKPDFEKSVINFKWQEYCHWPPGVNCKWEEYYHCPIRDINANNSNVATNLSTMVAFRYYLTVNGKYIATAL